VLVCVCVYVCALVHRQISKGIYRSSSNMTCLFKIKLIFRKLLLKFLAALQLKCFECESLPDLYILYIGFLYKACPRPSICVCVMYIIVCLCVTIFLIRFYSLN